MDLLRERSEMSGERTMSNIHTVRFSVMGGDADCYLHHDSLPLRAPQPLLFVTALLVQHACAVPALDCLCVCLFESPFFFLLFFLKHAAHLCLSFPKGAQMWA